MLTSMSRCAHVPCVLMGVFDVTSFNAMGMRVQKIVGQ